MLFHLAVFIVIWTVFTVICAVFIVIFTVFILIWTMRIPMWTVFVVRSSKMHIIIRARKETPPGSHRRHTAGPYCGIGIACLAACRTKASPPS